MARETITFCVDSDKKAALDTIAAGLGCDRSHVLNQALDAYIETHRWQVEHLREGVRQADAGEFAGAEDVAAALAKSHK